MVYLLIDIEAGLHAKLKHMAVDRNLTLKGLVIQLLERGVTETKPLQSAVR